MKKQKGFFAIVAIAFVIIVAFLGLAIAYMFVGGATSSLNLLQSSKAFYIAESGLEKSIRYLLTPLLSGSATRIACASLPGNANLTNSSSGEGTFTVTTVSGSPFFANSTLSSTISNSATTIPVSSTTNFASSGRIIIDNEAINYSAISGNNFIGVTRGVNNSIASSHQSGAYASQYQCNVDSQGGIPSIASPTYKREIQEAVQLQDAWAVGDRATNNFVFTHWNRPTELAWTSTPFTDAINRDNLSSISLLSNADGWAVGEDINNNFTIVNFSGTTWAPTPVAGACTGQILNSVSAVSSKEAWAVGVRFRVTLCTAGNYRYTVLYWNGSTWTELSSSTTPSIPADGASGAINDLTGVHVIDTSGDGAGDFGFAVGNAGTILRYNGSAWSLVSSPYSSNYTAVFVVSASEAWAVGASGRIIKWNGSSWSAVTSPTGTALNSIYMMDTNGDGFADAGWAVGNSGVGIQYNGSSWSSQNPGGAALNGVVMFSATDVWAVGNNGRVTHWNGSNWADGTSNVSANLNAIAAVAPKSYPFAGWQEIFP